MDEKVPIAMPESENSTSDDQPNGLSDQTTQPDQPNLESEEPAGVQVEVKLKTAEKQAKDYYDRLLRVSADFDNFRKRSSREMRDIAKYANEELIRELLIVVDNLERALALAAKEAHADDPLMKGVTLTLNEIQKILERQNVKPVEAMEKPFDPNFHQAMMQEETDDFPPNSVIRELQKGYMIHERLLRPAMVVVSKNGKT